MTRSPDEDQKSDRRASDVALVLGAVLTAVVLVARTLGWIG